MLYYILQYVYDSTNEVIAEAKFYGLELALKVGRDYAKHHSDCSVLLYCFDSFGRCVDFDIVGVE